MNHRHSSALISVVYPLSLLLVAMPFVNVTLSFWPLRFGEAPWRFGAFGMLMEAVVFPLLGVTVAALGAYWLGHKRVLQVISVLSLMVALLLLGGLVLFGLDLLQVRALVQPAGRLRFDVTVVRAVATALFAVLLLAWTARGGWKVARGDRQKAKDTESSEVLVRRRAKQGAMPTQ